jgi:hypothetical protein
MLRGLMVSDIPSFGGNIFNQKTLWDTISVVDVVVVDVVVVDVVDGGVAITISE